MRATRFAHSAITTMRHQAVRSAAVPSLFDAPAFNLILFFPRRDAPPDARKRA
jgi:hypothetical protein